MRIRISKATVDRLKPAEKEYIAWDSVKAGFGVRVAPSGARSYLVKLRIGKGRSAPVRKPTIGTTDKLTAEQARTLAGQWLGQAANGIDPTEQLRAERGMTMRQLLDRHLECYAKQHNREGTRDEYDRLTKLVPDWLANKPIATVAKNDIERLHRSLCDTPFQANRMLALLSKAFRETGGRDQDNPVRGVRRYHEDRRERFLSHAELARVTQAMAELFDSRRSGRQVSLDAIRFMILTGCRKGEALSATWNRFDLEKGAWTKPSAHTKQRREHRVPLSPPALQLLQSIPRSGEYVFPGRKAGTHLGDIKKTWAVVCEKADIEGVRPHDLRHTYASLLAASGMSLPIIGALLGHTQPGTTARYAHLADDPLREATERVGALVDNLGAGKMARVNKFA
jgi:integrase